MRSFDSMLHSQRGRAIGRLLGGMALLAVAVGMAEKQAVPPKKEPARAASTNPVPQEAAALLGGTYQFKVITVEDLRKQYPFRSLSKRLEYERERIRTSGRTSAPELSAEASKRLKSIEETLGIQSPFVNLRGESLKQLHSDQVEKFIAREGFGVGRWVMPQPSPSFLAYPDPPAPPVPFTASGARVVPPPPGPAVKLAKGEGAGAAGPDGTNQRMPSLSKLDEFHLNGQYYFISRESLGYVKDRDHVAGFQAHAFHFMPELGDPRKPGSPPPKEKWAVGRLELVSLLKHERPAVYISEELPRMEQLKKAKTRPLDEFEAEALKRLQKGEDVVTDAALNRIRMMGSLRAAKQCLECHSVRRGELLGCFSYDLHRVPPRRPPQ